MNSTYVSVAVLILIIGLVITIVVKTSKENYDGSGYTNYAHKLLVPPTNGYANDKLARIGAEQQGANMWIPQTVYDFQSGPAPPQWIDRYTPWVPFEQILDGN